MKSRGKRGEATKGTPDRESDIEDDGPLAWVSVQRCGKKLGFGRDSMTAFIAAGAPIVAQKMNPQATHEWLMQHWRELGKIRGE